MTTKTKHRVPLRDQVYGWACLFIIGSFAVGSLIVAARMLSVWFWKGHP